MMPVIIPRSNPMLFVQAHGGNWQHRVRSSKQRILYSELHPLSRHAKAALSFTEESTNEASSSLSTSMQETFVDKDEVDKLLVLDHQDADSSSIRKDDDRSSFYYDENSSDHVQDTLLDETKLNDKDELYQPIRISAVINEENTNLLTSSQKKYLLNEILSPALAAWKSALAVVPVIENLKVEKTQLYDEKSCGPGIGSGFPSPLVPEEHLNVGIPDTDLVVYISVSRFRSAETNKNSDSNIEKDDYFSATFDDLGTEMNTRTRNSSDFSSGDDDIIEQERIDNNIDANLVSNFVEINDDYHYLACDENQTIILIEGNLYMQEFDKLLFCQQGLEVINITECMFETSAMNETTKMNTIIVTPCDLGEIENIPYDRNDTDVVDIASFQCLQIYNHTNTTDIGYSVSEASILSCDAADLILSQAMKNEKEDLNIKNEAIPFCPSSALASAVYCSTDQFDRPVAGTLNYCLDDFFFSEENLERNILTTMHELGHILGMNSQSLAYFRNSDGTPMTERNEFGDVDDTEVQCTGADAINMTIPLPSSAILSFRNVRDIRVADIVTPSVRQVAANQFDCQSLHGAELEHGNENENSCIGNHWSRRIFRTDLMNPILDDVPFSLKIPPITLALFQDSGWYKIDASRSSSGNAWGRAAGCAFVDDKCVAKNGEINGTNAHFFCNERRGKSDMISEIHGCSSDFSRKAVCSLVDYEAAQETIPHEYQYFFENYGPLWGGSDADIDFCPVFTGFSNGQCNDEKSVQLQVHPSEKFGLSNSRCVYSEISLRKTSLCVPMACVISDKTLRLKVDGKWEVCKEEGEILELRGRNSDHIICPNPSRTCPSFYCPRNCLEIEGAMCDYNTGECTCSPETVNCKNSTVHEKLIFVDNVTEMALYFSNATVLANDRRGFFEKTQIAFEKMTTKQILIVLFFLVLGVLLVIIVVYNLIKHLENRRGEEKEKMVATVLVDLRVRANDVRRRRNERRVRERRRILENHLRKKMGNRYPHLENAIDQIILSSDSFSTAESTMPSKCTGNDNSVDLDSLSDNNTEQNYDSNSVFEEDHDREEMDLSFREGLEGNLYCKYGGDLSTGNSDPEYDELRRRNRSSVFRDDF